MIAFYVVASCFEHDMKWRARTYASLEEASAQYNLEVHLRGYKYDKHVILIEINESDTPSKGKYKVLDRSLIYPFRAV